MTVVVVAAAASSNASKRFNNRPGRSRCPCRPTAYTGNLPYNVDNLQMRTEFYVVRNRTKLWSNNKRNADMNKYIVCIKHATTLSIEKK